MHIRATSPDGIQYQFFGLYTQCKWLFVVLFTYSAVFGMWNNDCGVSCGILISVSFVTSVVLILSSQLCRSICDHPTALCRAVMHIFVCVQS